MLVGPLLEAANSNVLSLISANSLCVSLVLRSHLDSIRACVPCVCGTRVLSKNRCRRGGVVLVLVVLTSELRKVPRVLSLSLSFSLFVALVSIGVMAEFAKVLRPRRRLESLARHLLQPHFVAAPGVENALRDTSGRSTASTPSPGSRLQLFI